jgi:hypothetical protein
VARPVLCDMDSGDALAGEKSHDYCDRMMQQHQHRSTATM